MSSDQKSSQLLPQVLDNLILELRSSDDRRVGFVLSNTGDSPIMDVKLEWEYEAAGSSHPRTSPLRDRLQIDLAPGASIERWFDYSPDDGSLYVLAATGDGLMTFDVVTSPEALEGAAE
ncbi:MAG: hypothetical protein U1E29_15885 [Coriobacteriia bacterium]|nr:hypothetical protein [Coriobacteriia bacterium]